MNYQEQNEVINKFFDEGCDKIDIPNCASIREAYEKATNAPGCSSCAKRRARSKYTSLVRAIIKERDLKDVLKDQ